MAGNIIRSHQLLEHIITGIDKKTFESLRQMWYMTRVLGHYSGTTRVVLNVFTYAKYIAGTVFLTGVAGGTMYLAARRRMANGSLMADIANTIEYTAQVGDSITMLERKIRTVAFEKLDINLVSDTGALTYSYVTGTPFKAKIQHAKNIKKAVILKVG